MSEVTIKCRNSSGEACEHLSLLFPLLQTGCSVSKILLNWVTGVKSNVNAQLYLLGGWGWVESIITTL